MELADQVVVVTGAASGIGRAMARRFAAEGARGVVVADLDGDGASAVADAIGPRAVGVRCDVTAEDHAERLVAVAEEAFGPVDLYCANAGVAVGEEMGTPEDLGRAMAVNVGAHVLAARALLPGWLERGRGYFLSTASAAGVLTQIGSMPYAVSKHAAVAFAEWLSVTYGDRGIGVSCLCPMGVRTPLLEQSGTAADVVVAAGDVLDPDAVAEVVVQTLRAERFLVLPHPEVAEFLRRKADDPDRWLAGMRRLQAAILSEAPES
ncbi:MAG TPA: SDR family oxidoreductase [Capillimicrobium sp.]|nr:SDR family oxidoreductase [Capillimicrobium sp.]